jgi:hypothetical protein
VTEDKADIKADDSALPDLVEPNESRMPGLFALLGMITLIGITFAIIQYSTDALIGFDGYFHIKFSNLMLEKKGIIRELPWLQYTIHRDHYRDHHFFQHVLYLPFAWGDLRVGGKLAAWFFATAATSIFYVVVARRGKMLGVIFTLILLGASARFLNRMSMPRVPSMSMACLLLGAWALLARKGPWLAAVMFLYVWLYDGFILLAMLMACFTAAEVIVEHRPNWRLLAWGFGGMLAAMIINPYFPESLSSYWFNLVRSTGGMQVAEKTGVEWSDIGSWELFTSAIGVWLALGFGIFCAILKQKPTRATVALFLATGIATALAFKARRHMDTWPQLALLFAAYSWADFWTEQSELRPERDGRRMGATVLLACLIIITPFTVVRQVREVKTERPFSDYKGAALWLKENTKPGAVVFNGSWDDFPFLFFFNTHNYYIVGLDKLYLKRFDEGLYEEWKKIVSGGYLRPSKPMYEKFNARYLVINTRVSDDLSFDMRAKEDPNLIQVFPESGREYLPGERGMCTVYRIVPPADVK